MFTLRKIAELLNARVIGDMEYKILGVNNIEKAQKNELSFLSDKRYLYKLQESLADSIIVEDDFEINDSLNKNWIIVNNPKLSFLKIQEYFLTPKKYSKTISDQAIIHKTTKIGTKNTIYPLVFIDQKTIISNQNVIYPNVSIGENVVIGNNCIIYPNCSIRDRTIIGDNVIIHSGTVIGSDGFGYVQDEKKHYKIPQIGIVKICDNVEIGANCTIDRAAFDYTIIGEGTKIDNLVHIAHNVILGKNNLMLSGTVLAGSSKFGDNVYCSGQVGILGHNQIGDDVIFYPATKYFAEHTKIESKTVLAGNPAVPVKQWKKNIFMQKKIEQLEKRLKDLENKHSNNN